MKKLMRMVFDSNAIVGMIKSEIEKESGSEIANEVDFQNPLNIAKLSEIFKQGMVENIKKDSKGHAEKEKIIDYNSSQTINHLA